MSVMLGVVVYCCGRVNRNVLFEIITIEESEHGMSICNLFTADKYLYKYNTCLDNLAATFIFLNRLQWFCFCLFPFQVPAAAAAVQGSKNFHFSIYGKKNNAKVSDNVSNI